jgi:phytoene desaturase
VALCTARGVVLRPGTPVRAMGEGPRAAGWLQLAGGEVIRHGRLVSALDPARLRALRGQAPRPTSLSVSGLAIYAALPEASGLPRTTVLTPSRYREFGAALDAGALPPDTLTLIHAEGRQLATLLTVPPSGRRLDLSHPWVQAQLMRASAALGQDRRAEARATAVLSPEDYGRWGAPGGAIYGARSALWRSGPFHPQPRRLAPWLWQVGAGVHPGGGLPAVLGGALMTAEAMAGPSRGVSPGRRPVRSGFRTEQAAFGPE